MPDERENRMSNEQDLEAALRRLAQQVDVPPQPPYAARVQRILGSKTLPRRAGARARRPVVGHRSLRPLSAAAIALLLAIAVVLSVSATREAVADLFGVTGVRVRPLPTGAPSPRTTLDQALELGEPLTLAQARARLSFTLRLPSVAGLTAPDAVYIRREPGLESVTFVYRPRTGFPAVVDTTVGVLVSEYAGTAQPFFEKLLSSNQSAVQVAVAGQWPGLYFPQSQQVLVEDPRGAVHEDRPRLAAPSLVWVHGAITYRIEANIGRDRALAVAASFG